MKRIPELRDLSDDHHTGLALAQRCRQVGRPNSAVSQEVVWKQVIEAFADHLEPHFLIEEQHLLPALEARLTSSKLVFCKLKSGAESPVFSSGPAKSTGPPFNVTAPLRMSAMSFVSFKLGES